MWVEGQDVRVAAHAKNLSKGGMFVVAEGEAPTVGTVLQVKFEDPHEGAIDIKMEVVWRDEKTLTSNLGLRAVDSRGMEAFERVVTRYEAALPSVRVHGGGAAASDSKHPSTPAGKATGGSEPESK